VSRTRFGRRRLVAGLAAAGALAACSPAAPPTPTAGSTPAASGSAPPAQAAATAAPSGSPSASGAAAGAQSAAAKPPADAAGAQGAAAKPPAGATAAAAPVAARRGGGGTLKVLYWQAPTIVNPHLAVGAKDNHAARICLEPLISLDARGQITPILAAEVPSRQNGGLGEDGKTVTYKLKKDVKWADGQPFTAEDVVFTWQFVSDKATAATTVGSYLDLDRVEAVDPLTVRLTFKAPAPGWFIPFAGNGGMIVPKHALKDYVGAKARDAPFNLKAFGTGPFTVKEFKPGDLVVYEPNRNYRDPTRPYFDRIDLKGGGDAPSAARAVFQTGEYDYAWNLQVEWPVLEGLEKAGRGTLVTSPGGGVEQIHLNMTDPNREVDGERSSLKAPHPFLADPKVREALSLAIDRETMAKQLYGASGEASSNLLTTPTDLASKNTRIEFNLQKANQLLEDAGYKKGADGIRTTPQGARMKMVYATSINTLRQKEQAIVKDGWGKIGIEVELKAIDQSVYFDSSAGNPDTINHFYWDAMMHTTSFASPFPLSYMKRWYSGDPGRDIAQKANSWGGTNYSRWTNAEFNRLYDQASVELDVGKAREIWQRMNDLVVGSYVAIPLIDRKNVSGAGKALKGPSLTPFDSETWNIAEWTKA
jgi:peptide/nickel transport system substrate-binding protein